MQTFFTPVETFLGGYLLHMSTSALLEDTGTVLGVSGIVDGLIWGSKSSKPTIEEKSGKGKRLTSDKDWVEQYWRFATVAGMVLAPVIAGVITPEQSGEALSSAVTAVRSWRTIEDGMGMGRLVLAGVLVGAGSRLGSGCTSGHFLCGASRLSPRSIIATATFFPVAMFTTYLFPMNIPNASKLVAEASYIPVFPTLESLPWLFAPLLMAYSSRRILRRILPASPSPTLQLLPYLLAGWTFGMGLIMSGMANPLKVLSFLRISPLAQWDPSLAMVFLGGVIPNALAYRRFTKKQKGGSLAAPKPRYPWAQWRVPTRRDIDWRLIAGAAMFGAGWGLGGVCPGPAIVGMGSVLWEQGLRVEKNAVAGLVLFLSSMAFGMRLGRAV